MAEQPHGQASSLFNPQNKGPPEGEPDCLRGDAKLEAARHGGRLGVGAYHGQSVHPAASRRAAGKLAEPASSVHLQHSMP